MNKQVNTKEKEKHLFYLVDNYPADFPSVKIPKIKLTWQEAREQNKETEEECYWWAHSPNCPCTE